MRQIILIVLLAAAVRTAAAGAEVVIEHDSARYGRMARDIREGDWSTLDLYPVMPPLYPMLVALVGSGAMVSIVFGSLTCVPLFFLAEGIWNARIARLGALLYAMLPEYAVLGGQMMTEPTFICFFVTAVACLARRPSTARWLAAGFAGGLASLTRPEGVYVLAMIPGWALLSMIRWRAARPYLLPAAAGTLAWLATASPYLVWAREKAGHWTLSPNPVAGDVLRYAMRFQRVPHAQEWNPATYGGKREIDERMERWGVLLGGAVTLALSWSEILFYVGLIFLVAGIAAWRRDCADRWGAALMGLVGFCYLIPPILSLYVGMPYTDRYVVPGFAVLLPLAGVGVTALARRWRGATAVLLAVLIVAAPVKFARPRNERRLPLKEAGEWIASTYGARKTVFGQDMRIEYYSNGRFRRIPYKFADLEDMADAGDLIAVYTDDRQAAKFEPGYYEKLAAWAKVAEFPAGAPQVVLYERK